MRLSHPTELELLQLASGPFLTERIPDCWYAFTEEDQGNWLLCRAWGPVEDKSANELWELIENNANAIKELFQL